MTASPPGIAAAAFLIADPARAAMLGCLTDGRAWPAGALADAAGVTAQTASAHLAKLVQGGLLSVEPMGRYRHYRLAGPAVASALETLAALGPPEARPRVPSAEARALRFARCCYDHLAGQLAVAVTRAFLRQGLLLPAGDRRFAVAPAGAAWFGALGLDIAALKPGRHGLARPCQDWSEGEAHLAGPLGTACLALFREKGWMRLAKGSRAVAVTPAGQAWLRQELGLDPWRA